MATNPVVIDQSIAPAAQRPRRSRAARGDTWFAFWLVLPAILVVIGVSIYPVAYAVWTSLHMINPAMGMNAWVGLDNYRNVFVQQEFRTAAWVTFRFAASVTILTVLLGLLFTSIQAYEYVHAPFAFKGNIYGATFFMATGFHGFHVIVGTIFLTVCLIRAQRGDFTPRQHFGFEAAAWYWHFVDVVWLFLFTSIYVWGGWGAPIHG